MSRSWSLNLSWFVRWHGGNLLTPATRTTRRLLLCGDPYYRDASAYGYQCS